MKQVDLTKNSKEELMERITNRCAKDLKSHKIGIGLCLFILVFMATYMLWKHDTTAWEYSIVILIGLIECLIEGWWSNRLSKCDDAGTLVTTYDKYLKFKKGHFIIYAAVAVLIACLLFLRIKLSMTPVFTGILVCCITFGYVASLKKRKSAIAQDIDSLRKLIDK